MKEGYTVENYMDIGFDIVLVHNYKSQNILCNYGFKKNSRIKALGSIFLVGVWRIKQLGL